MLMFFNDVVPMRGVLKCVSEGGAGMAGGLLSMRSARRSVKFRMGQGMMCDEEVCLMGAGWCLSPGMRWRSVNPTLRTAMAALGWG